MKKSLKITLIILVVLIGIILLDTLQAKVLNNSPFIKITKTYSECQKRDIGIFVSTEIFEGKKNTTFNWKNKTLSLRTCGLDSSNIVDNTSEDEKYTKYQELSDRIIYFANDAYALDTKTKEYIEKTIFDYMLRSDNKKFDEIIESISKNMKEEYFLYDGGTGVYRNKDMTMIVCRTLDGNKDVYFGNSSMDFDDDVMCE